MSESTLLNHFNHYSKILHKTFILLLLVVFAAGCKKVNEQTGIIGVCPEVISTSPENGVTSVGLNSAISATFNEKMDSSSITKSTFLLNIGATPINGSVTYSGVTATFTPLSNLEPNTTYTGTITTGTKDMFRTALPANYVWSFTTGAAPDIIRPEVTVTDPGMAAAGVPINKVITVDFSEAMNVATINDVSFTITQGTTSVGGVVTYSGLTASFTPSAALSYNTLYTGTITTQATDLAGNAILVDYVWTFTTANETTPPTVLSTDPDNGATGVVLDKSLTVTFSEAMDLLTINNSSFVLKQGSTVLAGTISHTATTATFNPMADLVDNTTYTATITTGARDLAGNALTADYVWTFHTPQPVVPQPTVGSLINTYGAFGGSAGITNQGINTVINNGNIATTGVSTLVTGFHDIMASYTETPLNIGNVTGRIHTAPPPPGDATSFALATDALIEANALYNSISPASKPGGIDPGAGELGGLTLAPGIYKAASGTFKISNVDLTLDAMGDPNAVWIFQTAAGLTVGIAGPTGARSIIMKNGALPKNVFWHVGSAAVINGAGGGIMVGTIIAPSGVTLSTAGNAVQTVLNGRAISLNASVTMVNTTINVPN